MILLDRDINMHVNDNVADCHNHLGTDDDSSHHHFNLSVEELVQLQLEIARNFTRMFGESALERGQLQRQRC